MGGGWWGRWCAASPPASASYVQLGPTSSMAGSSGAGGHPWSRRRRGPRRHRGRRGARPEAHDPYEQVDGRLNVRQSGSAGSRAGSPTAPATTWSDGASSTHLDPVVEDSGVRGPRDPVRPVPPLERSDVTAIGAAPVIVEAMLALVLADVLLEKPRATRLPTPTPRACRSPRPLGGSQSEGFRVFSFEISVIPRLPKNEWGVGWELKTHNSTLETFVRSRCG